MREWATGFQARSNGDWLSSHTGLEGRGVQYRGFARFKIVDVQQACVRRKTPVLSQVIKPRQFR